MDPRKDRHCENLALPEGHLEERHPGKNGGDDEKPAGDEFGGTRALRRGVVIPMSFVVRFLVRSRSVPAAVLGCVIARMTDLRLAARMPRAGAEDRDDPRDDRAEKRQEDDRRIQCLSPSSC